MIREVNFVSYLPEFMQMYKEPIAALESENVEFALIWDSVNRVLKNRFIETADEYGLSRFEKMLNIYPNTTDTLENRRMRIQNRWYNSIPYTIRVLIERLIKLLGSEQGFSLWSNFKSAYELILTIYTIDDNQVAEVDHILATMIPENIFISIICESVHKGSIYFGAIMSEADMIEMKQKGR